MGKAKDADRRNQQAVAQRQDRVRSILKSLGLWEGFRGTTAADQLLRAYNPRVSVRLADGCPRTAETDAILRRLREGRRQGYDR